MSEWCKNRKKDCKDCDPEKCKQFELFSMHILIEKITQDHNENRLKLINNKKVSIKKKAVGLDKLFCLYCKKISILRTLQEATS